MLCTFPLYQPVALLKKLQRRYAVRTIENNEEFPSILFVYADFLEMFYFHFIHSFHVVYCFGFIIIIFYV